MFHVEHLLLRLNNGGGHSPLSSVQTEKSQLEAFSRGGVPVFSLVSANPRHSNDFESPVQAGRPSPPESFASNPINVFPRSDVPHANTKALAVIDPCFAVSTPVACRPLEFPVRIPVAISSMTVRFVCARTVFCIRLAYMALSHCARVARTAGPLDMFSVFCCKEVRSALNPISPPSASSS